MHEITIKEMPKILEGVYSNPELRRTCIPLFESNPGIGKTTVAKQFAEEKGVKLIDIIVSTKAPHEITGLSMPDAKSKTMVQFDSSLLLQAEPGDIIFFDEVRNGSKVVLDAFLTFLENRELTSGKKLADVMILAASNPDGALPMTSQTKERFIFYKTAWDPDGWFDIMVNKFGITKQMGDLLKDIINSEKFEKTNYNYYTPRSVYKAMNMIVNEVPTPYYDKLKPIIQMMVKNVLDGDIKYGDKLLKPGELVPWIDLVKFKK